MSTSSSDLANVYQSKTAIEHILDAPDTYIGPVDSDEITTWKLNEEGNMEYGKIDFIGGLYKTFDEGAVNCRDHVVRLFQKILSKEKNIVPVRNINVTVDKKTGVITMYNDGNGVDVAKHPDNDLWVPEMIFGHLRTSTNYNKEEKKIVGGKNGFGFKLVLIYSKWGEIETVDHIRKKKYVQRFEENLTTICPPTIKKSTSKPYTKVTWLPDYKRFGIDGLTDDMFNFFKKRIYDIGVITDKSVKVMFNGETLQSKSFENYMDLYIGPKTDAKRVFEKVNDRWEVGVCLSPLDEFAQVSFVNGVNTLKGGKHTDYILNQIIKKMTAYIEKKKKVKVKSTTIKEQLMLFVNCVIENPSFDSQTKECLNTPLSKFGSKCPISDKLIEKLAKMGVMEAALSLNELKQNKAAKKTDGRKSRNIRGIPKLMDANWAGGPRSSECSLILCEGDSAKAGIVSGLSKEDRSSYGVYPLKGKLMNTLGENQIRINNNKEITDIKKILGLQTGKEYNQCDIKKALRYGRVLIMTDQDLDGAHIKGLTLNMFHSQWKSLVEIPNLFGYMNTPILKATKGKKVKSFYNESDYEKWKAKNENGKGWKVKYYKGLGTSTSKEFKEYFGKKKFIMFKHTGDNSDNALDKCFNKRRSDDRKEWLSGYDKDRVLNPSHDMVTIQDFTDNELIHFSKYDCERSIPSAVDGMKTSQRKCLFAAFKKPLHKEMKVAQFGGYVSEISEYHHGEMSLYGTIVGMAQEFVGSNNISVLQPNGQFGTRLSGGKDSASERYIFTQLSSIARKIYPIEDDPLLDYINYDGTIAEPTHYLPIIPMSLTNGGKGIGTGFAYEGLCHNPVDSIKYLKNKLNNKSTDKNIIEPYYEGFKGTIHKEDGKNSKRYIFKGKYEVISHDTVVISELPIGKWTTDYKADLEMLMEDKGKNGKKKKPIVKNYNDCCTDAVVEFRVKFHTGVLPDLISSQKKVSENVKYFEKVMKLTTSKTPNLWMFNEKQKLRKYKDVYEIIDKYYPIRYQGYVDRKEYQIKKLERELVLISNRARFIKEQCDDVIDLRKKKKSVVIQLLKDSGYDVLDGDEDYKYLREMRLSMVEEENYTKLMEERQNKSNELEILKKTTVGDMWLRELNDLEKALAKYKNDRKVRQFGLGAKIKKGKKKTKKGKK